MEQGKRILLFETTIYVVMVVLFMLVIYIYPNQNKNVTTIENTHTCPCGLTEEKVYENPIVHKDSFRIIMKNGAVMSRDDWDNEIEI